MKDSKSILALAKQTMTMESAAIAHLATLLDQDFYRAVERIYQSKGRVVITGIGKSAIIATKIVATLNSTGTPAIFMHAADAIHGDLGLILEDDIVICISKSGNTPEIKVLVPLIKDAQNTMIAMTGNPDSFLGKQADLVLNTYVEKEACPNNLAPTTSTTAQLVMGDALAVCLLDLRGFSSRDFAKYHPGGALGKKLYLRVGELAAQNQVPKILPTASISEVIVEITEKLLGATAVLEDHSIVGIVTDGDLRRMLTKGIPMETIKAKDIMSKNPKAIDAGVLAIEAKETMERFGISQVLVTDNGQYIGMVHLHDLIREGII